MKVRESGMPDEELWGSFFNPEEILRTLQVNNLVDLVDFGSGYGTFAIPASKLVKGTVYAIDLEQEMVDILRKKIDNEGIKNIKIIERDFLENGSGFEDESVEYVMLFNILHLENPEQLLREAHRILRPGGLVGIIHWNYDPRTPRGPPMGIRPRPEQCIEWAESVGLNNPKMYDLKPYHYGLVMRK